MFDLPPVKNPEGQARDLSGPGVPCPNKTAGVLLGPSVREEEESGAVRVPGGWVQFHGYSALTPVPGGLVVGGVEQPLRPAPRERGGRVSDRPVVPLGFSPREEEEEKHEPKGVVVLPPFGGDRGVPRGHGERYERAKRRWRREQAEQARLRELEELEQRLRNAGRNRYADRVGRARERLATKRRERQEQRERLRDYKARKKREASERKAKREERWARKKRERRERRARWREEREKRPRRPTAPQGGYVIDVRNPDLDSLSPEQRRLLERDVARGWLDPSVLGLASERAPEPRRMGEWNVANAPLPFLGSVGSLEQWANVATYQLRALQQIVLGAFGGPDYLASNLALVDQSGTGHLLAGCGKAPVLTVRACGGVALCVEGDLVVKGRLIEASEAPEPLRNELPSQPPEEEIP